MDPENVAAVNREIVAYCEQKKAEIEAAWRDPKRRQRLLAEENSPGFDSGRNASNLEALKQLMEPGRK